MFDVLAGFGIVLAEANLKLADVCVSCLLIRDLEEDVFGKNQGNSEDIVISTDQMEVGRTISDSSVTPIEDLSISHSKPSNFMRHT